MLTSLCVRVVPLALLAALMVAAPSAGQVPEWHELGPVSVGGRVTALAVDPADAAHLIVGTPAAGVWESRDGGTTWTALTLWLAPVPISALAISDADPRRVLLGTGRISDAGSVEAALGVLRTGDGGATWTPDGAPGQTGFVSGITFWPGEPDRVLVATDRGIRLSTDGGGSFVSVLDGEAVYAVVADRTQIGAAVAASRTGLFRSSDRGATWTRVSHWPLLETDEFGAGTTALAVSSVTPGLLYATVQVMASFNETARVLLLRSNDGGTTFVELTPPPSLCPTASSCGFAHALALAENDTRLYAGGAGLAVSTTGGESWTPIDGIGGIHTVTATPARTYLAGTSGVATLGPGATSATLRNSGLAITQVVDLDVTAGTPARLLVATADSGTLIGTAGDALTVERTFAPGEPAGGARFDPFDTARLIVSKRGGDLYRSQDGGVTFAPVTAGLDLSQAAAAIAPVAASAAQPGAWYTGRLQMFESTSGGDVWAPFRPAGSPEIGVIAASPVVAGRVYFATRSGGHLYKADGETTEQLTVADDATLRLTSVFLDGAAQNQLYVSATDPTHSAGRLYKSADFGVTWTDVTPAGLAPAATIVKDRFGALYAGTSDGVWRSANDGYTWVPFRNRLFAGGVNALRIGTGWIFAGTTGRGVFRTPEQTLFSLESIAGQVRFRVDGELVTAPFLMHWEPGTQHTIEPVVSNTTDIREDFLAWSDGGTSLARTITAGAGSDWLLAAVRRAFRLQGTTAPTGGGSLAYSPASPDGFYPQQSVVTVIPVPADDHRLVGFGGAISGSDGLVAYAEMDRPRTVQATFAPLRTVLGSNPDGITLTVDGHDVVGPRTEVWTAGSVHGVSAPEIVGAAGDLRPLAFDGWTDLLPRVHDVKMTRNTFVTDLTARYIRTAVGVEVPASGSRVLTTERASDAPRLASLTMTPSGGGSRAPSALQFVRGAVGQTSTMELAVVPSVPRTWTNVYVEQDLAGEAGRIRLAFFNRGTAEASVGVLVRDAAGVPITARLDALRVGPDAGAIAFLDDLLPVPAAFSGLVSLVADRPLVASVHAMRSNRRALDFLDPLLVAPFTPGDQDVPAEGRVQALLLTPATEHRLVLVNAGFEPLTGSVQFRDADNQPLEVALEGGPRSTIDYAVPAGGFRALTFPTPAGTPAGGLPVAWALVVPAGSQPAPALQLLETTTIPGSSGPDARLPRSVPPSNVGSRFSVPVDAGRRESGAVLNNVTPSPIAVTMRALSSEGIEVGRVTRTLAGWTQEVFWAADVPGLPAGSTGTLSIELASPVFGVGVSSFTNERQERSVAGFPLLTPSSAQASYAFTVDGDSWRAEWWFVNPTGGPLAASLASRGARGRHIYFPIP